MITIEQLKNALDGDNNKPFQTKNVDYDVKVISLLRERIPYEVCNSIINGAGHDIIYLCDIEQIIPYLTEEDLLILVDCNVVFDEDCLSLFV